MIGDLARFALFNLAASLAAGLLVALVVLAVTRGLGLRDARVRSWLLGAALVKATLVLAGLSTFLPFALDWPMAAGSPVDFGAGPLPPAVVGPIILVWAGAALLVRVSLARRVRAAGGIRRARRGEGQEHRAQRRAVLPLHPAARPADARLAGQP
jgi:hypothetical protein